MATATNLNWVIIDPWFKYTSEQQTLQRVLLLQIFTQKNDDTDTIWLKCWFLVFAWKGSASYYHSQQEYKAGNQICITNKHKNVTTAIFYNLIGIKTASMKPLKTMMW